MQYNTVYIYTRNYVYIYIYTTDHICVERIFGLKIVCTPSVRWFACASVPSSNIYFLHIFAVLNRADSDGVVQKQEN